MGCKCGYVVYATDWSAYEENVSGFPVPPYQFVPRDAYPEIYGNNIIDNLCDDCGNEIPPLLIRREYKFNYGTTSIWMHGVARHCTNMNFQVSIITLRRGSSNVQLALVSLFKTVQNLRKVVLNERNQVLRRINSKVSQDWDSEIGSEQGRGLISGGRKCDGD